MSQSAGVRIKVTEIKKTKRPLLWDITLRVVAIPYRRLGKTRRPHTLRNIPEERRSHLLRGEAWKHIKNLSFNHVLRKILGNVSKCIRMYQNVSKCIKRYQNVSKSFTAVFPSRFSGCGYRACWLEYGADVAISVGVLWYVRASKQERQKLHWIWRWPVRASSYNSNKLTN